MNGKNGKTCGTVESQVFERYTAAARVREAALCCPVNYPSEFLSAIPNEVIERDYGCGDPTPYLNAGDTVLDLGCGGGKLCFIAAQVVGPTGRVIGVDCNREMLGLAIRHAPAVAARIGFANVEFRYGLIQDLQLDLQLLDQMLAESPVRDATDYLTLRNTEERLRAAQPLVPTESIDCVVSNCVLNLVRQADRRQMFAEIFRVLKRGGRAAISDIVADEEVPDVLRDDPTLWSGCISGAFREDQFLQAFEDAGFHGIEIVRRTPEPWQTVHGIEFRSMTVLAHKGKQGPCLERNQAVIYRGPFKSVVDDDGHTYRRGHRGAVCDKTFELLHRAPYQSLFEFVSPRESIPSEIAASFDCGRSKKRDPRETKGHGYAATNLGLGCGCEPGGNCG